MKRGHDGIWRTVGGIPVSKRAPAFGQTFTLHNETFKQIQHYKETGEMS